MPKRLVLIALYMIFIFFVFIAETKYAKHHPLEDAGTKSGKTHETNVTPLHLP